MQVKLNELVGETSTPLGNKPTVTPGVWRVDVYDDALKGPPMFIESGMMLVGTIGTQNGANFCENDNFLRFAREQQQAIVDDVKRLHGSASTLEPVKLEEPIVYEDDEDEDDEDYDQ